MGKLSLHEKSPVDLSIQIIAEHASEWGGGLSDFTELSYLEFVLHFHPRIETHVIPDEAVWYSMDDKTAEFISVMANGNEFAHEIARRICAYNVINGREIPEGLRTFAFQSLMGNFKKPTKAGPLGGMQFGLKYGSVILARYLKNVYEIPLTRADGMNTASAADCVVSALDEFGIDLKYSTLRDWLTHPSYKKDRGRILAADDMFSKQILLEAGALKRPLNWFFGPHGEFVGVHTDSPLELVV